MRGCAARGNPPRTRSTRASSGKWDERLFAARLAAHRRRSRDLSTLRPATRDRIASLSRVSVLHGLLSVLATMTDESTALAVVEIPDTVAVSRDPALVLADARKAAQALIEVITAKPHRVVFGGEQYIENEDWQLIGRFYGVTAKTVDDHFVTFADAQGWEATAVATDRTGREIARATSMCLNDEPNWRKRPLFQLRSMAATRAHSKALSQVLKFVPVLAGYRGTPADELESERQPAPRKTAVAPVGLVTPEQRIEIVGLVEQSDWSPDDFVAWLKNAHGVDSTKRITQAQFPIVVEHLRTLIAAK